MGLHILGFAKADQIHEFARHNITSFDTTSPLLRAFKDSKVNYYLPGSNGALRYYMAIRIPQALENNTLKRLVKSGRMTQEKLDPTRTERTRQRSRIRSGSSRPRANARCNDEIRRGLAYRSGSGRRSCTGTKARGPTPALPSNTRRSTVEGMQLRNLLKDFRGSGNLSGQQSQQASRHSQSSRLPPSHQGERRVGDNLSHKLTFSAIKADQSPRHAVFSFAASAAQVFEIGSHRARRAKRRWNSERISKAADCGAHSRNPRLLGTRRCGAAQFDCPCLHRSGHGPAR